MSVSKQPIHAEARATTAADACDDSCAPEATRCCATARSDCTALCSGVEQQLRRQTQQMGIWERKAKAGAIGGVTGFMVGGAAAALQMRGRHAGPAALFLACVIGAGAAFRQT